MPGNLCNHSVKESYPPKELSPVKGIHLYGSRILASTNENDIVQLDPELQEDFGIICGHYRKAGLPHSETIIWDESFEIAGKYPEYDWSSYIFSEVHHSIKPDEKFKEIVRRMNDKNFFIRLCQDKNWAVPETKCFDNKLHFRGSEGIQFPCYLKIGCSASGSGVFYCENLAVLSQHISALGDGIDFQIQQPVDDAIFLSVQYKVEGGRAVRVVLTEQILHDCSHVGNRYTSNYGEAPWDLCDPVAQYMAEQGMKGPFGFDVAFADGKFLLIECNPRFTGCTYYSLVAEKIKASTWVSRNVAVKQTALKDVDMKGLVWNSETGRGIIIVLWGPIRIGKLGILFAGNSEEDCQELFEEFRARNGETVVNG